MSGFCETHLHPHNGGAPKRSYKSHQQADAAIRTIMRKGEKRFARPVRPYLCPGCKRWFLTSQVGDGDGRD